MNMRNGNTKSCMRFNIVNIIVANDKPKGPRALGLSKICFKPKH